ncbi:MAG: hypothetical protein ABI405_08705, partial [Parafilimonas sp.]
MKKNSFLFLTAIAFASCNSGTATNDAMNDSSASTASATTMNYPYTIDHPDYWNMGSNENTMVALSALKAFENGDVPGSVKYFGDSVQLQFDAMDTTLSNDALKTMFTNLRNGYKSMDVKMGDWESVISKDKTEEWVTVWYRQKWEDVKGNKDSSDYINDLKLKDGKIVR